MHYTVGHLTSIDLNFLKSLHFIKFEFRCTYEVDKDFNLLQKS